MENFRRSITRTSSQTSESNGDESCEFAEQEETTGMNSPETVSLSTEWTNEKHSLYLKSMEATFVNQLYDSMNMLGWRSQKEKPATKSSRQMHLNTRTPSGQFKVLRVGSWEKINFERAEPQLNKADESCDLLRSPWIQHFRSSCKPNVVASPPLQDDAAISQEIDLSGEKAMSSGPVTYSNQFHACHSQCCHHDLVDSQTVLAEVSDQNFIDEDIKGENVSSKSGAKRKKPLISDASSNDQVVPCSESPVTDVTEKCVSAAR